MQGRFSIIQKYNRQKLVSSQNKEHLAGSVSKGSWDHFLLTLGCLGSAG